MSERVTDRDLGYHDAEARLRAMTAQHASAGLWNQAVNEYGERLLTVAYAQGGSRGAAPKWITRANRAVLGRARGSLGQPTYDALLSGQAPSAIAQATGIAMRGELRAQVESAGLVDTGALRDAMDWETSDHPHRTDFQVTRTRTKLRSAQMSSGQSLYQAYHKGRSRSMQALRSQVTFRDFRAQHATAWRTADAAGRRGIRRAVTLRAREISAAQRGTTARHQRTPRRTIIQARAQRLLAGRAAW